jgi:hypothetical protein
MSAAQEQPAPEPIYQVMGADGRWTDQTKNSYLYNLGNGQAVRVLYATHPTPAAQEQPAPERNNPISALAIRLLVAAGHVTQEKADEAFGIACRAIETEAQRMNITLPWVKATHPTPAERAERPVAWNWLRGVMDGIPTREEPIGGQMQKYVAKEAVMGWIAEGQQRAERADQPPRDAVQQGLTDEQIDALWRQAASADGFTTAQFVREFARAIVRAALKGQP